MKIEEILKIDDFGKMIGLLTQPPKDDLEQVPAWEREYHGQHKILTKPDKYIYKDKNTPRDEETVINYTIPDPSVIVAMPGDTRTLEKVVPTAKNVFVLQQNIVKWAKMMLFGAPLKLIKNDSDETTDSAFQLVKNVWKKAKADSRNLTLAEDLMVYTQALELWTVDKDKKIHLSIFSRRNGNELYPHFDEYGDLDAITRKFRIREGEKESEVIEVYTAQRTIRYQSSQSGNSWEETVLQNDFGKILAVYYEQPKPEWYYVQGLIDRLEDSSSGHSDTNDYNVDPVLKLKGNVINMPSKGETGKILQFESQQGENGKIEYGDADFATWDQSIDSLKYEQEQLAFMISKLTFTPDIDPDKVKGMGTLTGVAIQMLFFPAILKAQEKKIQIFNEALARRINILKAILKFTETREASNLENVEIGFEYGNVLPRNKAELAEMLAVLRPGKSQISMETAVNNLPFDVNESDELNRLQEEEKQEITTGEKFDL